MFTDLLTSMQGMDNTALTVFFACIGVVYFMFIKPSMQSAQDLQKLQTEKLGTLPSEEDISKLIDESMTDVATTASVDKVSEKIDELIEAITTINQDLGMHVADESSHNVQQLEMMETIHASTVAIGAVVDHLVLELGKTTITPINRDELNTIKHAAINMQHDVARMLSFINQQMTQAGQSRHTKLNRVMSTRA